MKNLNFLKTYYRSYLSAHLKSGKANKNMHFKDIGILNPAIGTTNLGDMIIYESVYKYLREIYPNDQLSDFPTQFYTSFDAMKLMNEKNLLFISGTNLLSSNMDTRHQWKIHGGHKKFLKNKVVLFGCGWWQYQGNINNYTKGIYEDILSKDTLHAVRDQYTVEKLNSIGIENVVNTTCPTLWTLTPDKCKDIPTAKGNEVVTTLTNYHKNAKLDYRMLEILSKNYEKVYLWIQHLNDIEFYNEINSGFKNIEFVSPNLESYDKILLRPNIDYVGTRLHAGVRALQSNIRTLILAVDNRALEIGKDVNLNVINREDVEVISSFINNDYRTDIKLPVENIENWRKQFT